MAQTQHTIDTAINTVQHASSTVMTQIRAHCAAVRANVDRAEREWLEQITCNNQALMLTLSEKHAATQASTATLAAMVRDGNTVLSGAHTLASAMHVYNQLLQPMPCASRVHVQVHPATWDDTAAELTEGKLASPPPCRCGMWHAA